MKLDHLRESGWPIFSVDKKECKIYPLVYCKQNKVTFLIQVS